MNSEITVNPSYLLKRIHLYGIVWFLACLIFLIAIEVERIGFSRWVVFSISGYSAVLSLFLTVVYLFAIYKGVTRNSNSIEHPLTTCLYYVFLYESAPFLGVVAGLCVVSFDRSILPALIVVSQGTLLMTVVMWIIIDTLVDFIESSLPKSAAYRKKRLAENQRIKKAQILERQQMLETVLRQEKEIQSRWTDIFKPYASEVADLLCSSPSDMEHVERRIAELGAMAWKQGEHLGMTYFHDVILDELKSRPNQPSVDFVAQYWGGIGTWRRPSIIHAHV